MKRLAPAVALALLLVGFSKRADAGPGIRVGLTEDPDTIFGGFFYEIPLGAAGPGVFVLDPGGDLGIGIEDRVDFTLRGSLNVEYFIPINQFYLYPLMGLSVMYVNYDNDHCGGRDHCNDTDAGLNLGLGFAFLERFNLELYATVDDIPDLTFSFGFSF
jgi:hypothetical protein